MSIPRLPDMDIERMAIRRAVNYIDEGCSRDTLTALTRDVGVNQKSHAPRLR